MSLLAEAQAFSSSPGGKCGIALLVRRLSETEQAELDEALASDVSAMALTRALEGRGFKVNHQTISRHRAGRCACPR